MWQQLLFSIVGDIFKKATPVVKDKAKEAMDTLEELANSTPNPVDNMLVNLLKEIMKVGDDADSGN